MYRHHSSAGDNSRNRMLRGVIASVMAFVLVFGAWTGVFAAEGGTQPVASIPSRTDLDEALRALQSSLAKAEPVSDWVALGLARSGKPAATRYLPEAEKSIEGLRLVTDYARIALAVNANGGDVRKFGKDGTDLLSKIANFEKMTAQGPNAPAYALMALDAGDYAPGLNDRWSRDSLIKWLVDRRNADGGWSLVAGTSDVDVTGIVLTALAPYQTREDVRGAVDAALGWLSGVQRDNGGFGGSAESSESSVQALIALTSLGIDPVKDSRFLKNGKSALARLLEFRQGDGRFAHVPGGKADGMSSLYALLGLTAVQRWQDGLPGLYAGNRNSGSIEIALYGPNRKLAQETVQGRTAMESLIGLLQQTNTTYEVTRHPQFGAYMTGIAGVKNASFGGFDGWQYAVERGGEWLNALPGMTSFMPESGDRIVVYYGDSATALIHSVKVEPAAPREGMPVNVTVEKEIYDWNTGKAVVSPAEGALISLAGRTAVTDKDGKAELNGVPAGPHTLKVEGYRTGAAPQYAAFETPVRVNSYVKTVSVRVEGDRGLLAEGTAKGGTALDALESFLKARSIKYEVKDSSYGKFLTSIGDTANVKYGGADGWSYAVKDGPSWIVPTEGIGTFLLEDGQDLVVYYGDNAKLPEPAVVVPSAPKPGNTVTVSVYHREMDWNTGHLLAPAPLAGAKVTAGGVSAATDAEGKAKLTGLQEGVYNLEVTGYADSKAPFVVRTVAKLTVAGDYIDQSTVSDWAVEGVRTARAAGVLFGPHNDAAAGFKPKAAVTRAEFVSALVRALGLKPESGSSFKDVAAKAWYAADLEAAAKAGLIAGVSPGKFAPESKLTREQAAQLLVRALKIETAGSVSLADSASVAKSAMQAVQAVLEQGWMTAFNGKFSPKQSMSREQAAVIAVRVLLRPGIGKLGK